MLNDEVLAAIASARKSGSFKFRIVFTMESEISQVRTFVVMLNSGAVSVDDATTMKLRLVAITRRWQEDTDRVVIVEICNEFDENEFVAKFRHAIENIEAIPVTSCPTGKHKKHDGAMTPKTAIRRAFDDKGECELRVIIPKATGTDLSFFMALVKQGSITFTDQRERLVFEDAARHNDWALGGRFSADVSIKKEKMHEHQCRRILDGAHAKLLPGNIKIVR